MSEVKNPSKQGLVSDALERGFDLNAVDRLIFRLGYVEQKLEERKLILKNGNIADLSVELVVLNVLTQDLLDTVRELVTLLSKNFREEQGLITPPNPPASGTETPEST